MDYRYEFAPTMLAQANAIYEYRAADSAAGAEKWYASLFREIETLRSQPERCPVVASPDGSIKETRMLLLGDRRRPDCVLFQIEGDRIRIVGIRNSRQQPDSDQ